MTRLTVKYAAVLTFAALGIGVSMGQGVLAQEVIATSQLNEINSVGGAFAHSATDLQPIAQTPIDLNKFCRDFPLNSRCTQITPPATTPSPSAPREVRPTEQTSQTPGGKRSGWAITPEIGTLGIGGSVTRSITPNFNARVGINAFGVGADITATDVTYEADLNLSNISTLIDYHPAKNSGFRLTGGLIFQDNNLKGTARPTNNTTITVGGDTYTVNVLESVDAKLTFANSVAPYLGIGWGNAVQRGRGLGFSFNLGVMFSGSPKIGVTPTFGPDATQDIQNEINNSIEQERRDLEDDLDWLKIYPVLSFGISYQF